MHLRLRHKVNGAIVITFLLITVVFTAIQLPFQQHRFQTSIDSIGILLQTLVERDLEQLANEIFDSRLKAIELRLKEMRKVEGVLIISIFDDSGKLLVSEGATIPEQDLDMTDMKKVRQQTQFQRADWQGESALIFFQKISFLNEHLGFIRIYYSLLNVERNQRLSFLIFGGLLVSILLVMLIVLNVILSRAILYPIQYLRDATTFIAEGNLNEKIKMSRKDELGNLANSFANMRDSIKDKINDLKRLTTIMESTSDLVSISTPEAKVLYMNNAGRKMVGWEEEESLDGKSIPDVHPEWAFEKVKYIGIPSAIKSGIWKNETAVIGCEGRELPVSQIIMSHKTSEGELEYISTIMRDISDRKLAEATLKESEEKYRTVLEANPDPVVVYDMEGKATYFNPAFTRVFGWTLEERLGKKMDVFVPEKAARETQIMIDKVMKGEPFFGIETYRYIKNGKIIPVSVSGAVYKDQNGKLVGSIINLRDITEQKRLEAQLQQAQKMEAIGTLAGGIAHDFNNILSAILGYSELMLADLPPDASFKNKLEAIHSSGERARDLVSQILAYSRKDDQVRAPVEIHLILQDSLKLLRPAIPKTIDIETNINSTSRILGDPSRLHQIIMNLCTNAYQSMLETGGMLKISLSDVEMEGEAAVLSQVPIGSYAKLIVSDTGTGIPPDNIGRIFDPYFTTKEKGKGTGLGLAAVHGIVKSHGGSILVDSEVEQGTTFEVYLPLTRDKNDGLEEAETQIIGGDEHILLIDDENDILEISGEMLTNLGYVVTTADNAPNALKSFAENPEKFDLVLTDMTMPKMGGDQLAGELKKIKPDIPIILCTGFSEVMSEERAASLGIQGFLMKPVSLKDLSNMVRKILDKKPN